MDRPTEQELLFTLLPSTGQGLRFARNQGKGAALRLGFASTSNPFIFVQDADLEYKCPGYRLMIAPLYDERADMVYGSRFFSAVHIEFFFIGTMWAIVF